MSCVILAITPPENLKLAFKPYPIPSLLVFESPSLQTLHLVPKKFLDFLSLLALVLQEAGTASVPETERKREAQPHGEGYSNTALHLGNCLPTCLVCMCLGSSVSNNTDLERILHLPQTTTYLYTCFNHIHQIQARDFKGLTKLKRADLSSNFISSISDNALYLLPALQDLILTDNQLAALPRLPVGIEVLDICLNWLQSWGIKPRVFSALEKLHFLYLVGNLLDSIPGCLPLSLCSLHLQNNMIKTMQSDTFCDEKEHKQTQRRLEDYCLDGSPSTWASSLAPTSACHSSLQAASPSSPLLLSPGVGPWRTTKGTASKKLSSRC
ncbi:LOW QUALITY PROTEIN: opticin [Glossophaga mutica]